MGREERLQLLFASEPSLLKMDTGLRVSVGPVVLGTEDNTVAVSQNATSPIQQEENKEPKDTTEHPKAKDVEIEANLPIPTEEPISEPQTPNVNISGSFCHAIALSRFPYKFIRDNISQLVASEFFDEGKFWERSWDLYYLPIPPHIGTRPLILIPATQAEQLVKEINGKFETCYTIPSIDGFVLDFQDDGDGLPQPGFLGRSTSRSVKDRLEAGISAVRYDFRIDEAVPEYQTFERKIKIAVQLCKSRNKTASKAKKIQARLETERRWIRCLGQTQTYFGLRLSGSEQSLDEGQGQTEESQEPQETPWKHVKLESLDLNLDEPVPHAMAHEPIFISIDIESNERCHLQVTEIGISVLDTRDLNGIPPGKNASNWTSRIRSRHLRVREYAHVVNHDFVAGCPDRFEFGESEWASREEMPSLIQDYIVQLASQGDEQRNLVFVGHSPSADIRYLQEMKVPVFKELKGLKEKSVFIDTIDTAEIYRVSRQETNPRSLGGVLAELGVTAWNLHNAGNDARYTLQAMTMLAMPASQDQ